jgi:hypothetical protein
MAGRRYKTEKYHLDTGRDRNPQNETDLKIWRAMATGILEGAGKDAMISYHHNLMRKVRPVFQR